MKKYLAIAMAALLLVCSLASCAGGNNGDIGNYAPEVDYLITEKGMETLNAEYQRIRVQVADYEKFFSHENHAQGVQHNE